MFFSYERVHAWWTDERTRRRIIAGSLVGFFFFILLGNAFVSPAQFPTNSLVTVPRGASLESVAEELQKQQVVGSSFLFSNLVIFFGTEKRIISGDYVFKERLSLFGVVQRLIEGEFGLVPVVVTIPEGSTLENIEDIFANRFVKFERAAFRELTAGKEGYLFPDTYFFLPNATAAAVVYRLEENFHERIGEIEEEITAFGKPISDVAIMASLLEKEARTTQTRRTIAGILWKRLSLGMPLQVDAVFPYIIGKNTFEVTTEDLLIDSPYNTYNRKGLPIAPIANPGLDSLRAAVTPKTSPYLYYLSDLKGNMHYGKTYGEHLRNKARYLP